MERDANFTNRTPRPPVSHELPRVHIDDLSVDRFLIEYVSNNRPVVVTGAFAAYDLESHWSPAALGSRFGDSNVQVYNNYFDLQNVMLLKHYISRYLESSNAIDGAAIPYVRWYAKLRNESFCWADDAFVQLCDQWEMPRFLPTTDYVLPWSNAAQSTPVTDPFPAKGLFIAPRGARTSLHVDPWGSCAVLCQLHGKKRWYLYDPGQESLLRNTYGVVDVTRPDHLKFPMFATARVTAVCTLAPGEVIYVPHGWYHQVECESDSVSLTWNFVHRATTASLVEWLERQRPLSRSDQGLLRFFYDVPRAVVTGSDVTKYLKELLRL